MQIISMNAGTPVYLKANLEPKHALFKVMIHVLLVYLSCYGLISIYVDNIIIRSLKDAGMLFLAVFALSKVYRSQHEFIIPFIFLLGSVTAIGSMNLLLGGSMVSLIYGLKITFLPIMMMFTGMLICRIKGVYLFARINLIILLLLITGWLIQYSLGIQQLISLGFVYGVNIKNYLEGVPRLSSITYSPDGYAYALLITGLIAEKTRLAERYRLFRLFIQILTISFLLFSTIRSALVLWLVYQIVMFFLHVRKYNKKNMLLLAGVFLLLPAVAVFVTRMLDSYNLLSISSLLDRFQSWGVNLTSPFTMAGVIGSGLGSVGAASRRTHIIGLQSNNFAVDNQYFSFYEQTGWLGLLYWFALFMWIMVCLVKQMNRLPATNVMGLPQMAIALGIGVAAASLTTNVLEMFPGNISIWIVIGMALYQHPETDVIPYEAGELK